MTSNRRIFLASAIMLASCGGGGESLDGAATQSGAAVCPGPPPQGGPGVSPGDSCVEEGLACSYGNWPGVCGREVATCKGGRFQGAVYNCRRATECPATAPATGGPCSVVQPANACVYQDGTRCACAAFAIGSWHWLCNPPPADPRCPRQMPQLGAGCAPDDVDCDYQPDGWHMRCQRGLWR